MCEKKNKEEEKNLAFVGSTIASSLTLLVPPQCFQTHWKLSQYLSPLNIEPQFVG
jgi:hypothetical protein